MMQIMTKLASAAIVAAGLMTASATPAAAQTSVTIAYHDGYHGSPRGYHRGWRDRDGDGIPNRYDRYDNRRGNYGYRGDYGHRGDWRDGRGWRDRRDWRGDRRYRERCWTDWRYDRYYGRRVPVRICR